MKKVLIFIILWHASFGILAQEGVQRCALPKINFVSENYSNSSLPSCFTHATFFDSLVPYTTPTNIGYLLNSASIDEKKTLMQLLNKVHTQLEQIHTILLCNIDQCYHHLEYWKMQYNSPISYFLSKGPKKWFIGENQKEEIQIHINELNYMLNMHATQLSKLQQQVQQCRHFKNINELLNHVQNIACIINAIVKQQPTIVLPVSPHHVLTENDQYLTLFKNISQQKITAHTSPNHFTRNWIAYSLTALGLTTAGIYAYKNSNALQLWMHDTKNAALRFVQTHAFDPIKNIINHFYQTNDGMNNDLIMQPEQIEIDMQKLQKLCVQYLKDKRQQPQKVTDYLNHIIYPEYTLSSEEIHQIEELVSSNIKQGKLPPEIEHDITSQAEYPVKNALLREMVRLTYIFLTHRFVLQNEKALQKIDGLLQANKINLQILLAIPTTIALYGMYKGAQHIHTYLLPKPLSKIKKGLIQLESILNKALYTDSGTSQGLIHYWLHNLINATKYLPIKQQSAYLADLQELDSPELTIDQKIATIQRMYRAYAFLQ